MHRFEDQLNFSNDLSDDPAWDELYRRVWPEVLTIQRIPNGLSQWQQWGIDRELKLPNGRTITVDEKKRRADKNGQPYRDIALEYWSQYYGDDAHPKNRLGWAIDPNKRCD